MLTSSFADEEPSIRDLNMEPGCVAFAREIFGGHSPGPSITIECHGSIYSRECLLGFAVQLTILTLTAESRAAIHFAGVFGNLTSSYRGSETEAEPRPWQTPGIS